MFVRGFLGRMLFSGEEIYKKSNSAVGRREDALHDFTNDDENAMR